MTTAGLGCRRGCAAEDILALLAEAAGTAGVVIQVLAVPHFKHAEPGLIEAARRLGVPLVLVSDAALAAAQPRCPTRSLVAARVTGHASVAEACALAATQGRLILPRIANGRATVALAA